jgi:hypothetical protein
VSETALQAAQSKFGLVFPGALCDLFREVNGGAPHPYVYENQGREIVVQTTLPLTSDSPLQSSAQATYESRLFKGRVPKEFFPFAIDPSGNVFCVDCSSGAGMVYWCEHEIVPQPLDALNVSLQEFWKHLVPDAEAPPSSG